MKIAWLIVLPWFGLSACAHVETRLPVPDADQLVSEKKAQSKIAAMRYRKLRNRLNTVSMKILEANAPLCEETIQDIGVRTHTLKSYPKHMREFANLLLGAEKTPSIKRPHKTSKFKKADVLVNDSQIAIAHTDKNLQAKLRGGATSVTVRRDGQYIQVPITPIKVCNYKVVLRPTSKINAYATGKSIIVTTGMMDFAKTNEELALVVGHELAHNTMSHIRKGIQNRILSGFATRTTRPFEAEADYVGLYYMARAGYATQGVEMFWQRLGVQNPKNIMRAKSHPITASRLLSIRLAAKEIKDKQQAGEPLVPNALE